MKNRVIILSDAVRTGKTTVLQEWVKKRQNVSGFLSPDINGKRMFQDVETGEVIPMETENKDLKVGRFAFDSHSFLLVEKRIKKTWNKAKTDFLIIDEIGPLEIKKNLGFHNLLKYLQDRITQNSNSPSIILIVRNYALDAFLKKYNFKNVEVYTLAEFIRSMSL